MKPQLKISIEPDHFSETRYYAGVYSENNEEYEFTLVISENMDLGTLTLSDITWVSESPAEESEARQKITNYYLTN